MRTEKVLKREDGTQYKIIADVYLKSYGTCKPNYSFEVETRGKGKRKWNGVYNFDGDYKWRSMNMEQRRKFCEKKYLTFVTYEEVNETYNELHLMLKPEFLKKTD